MASVLPTELLTGHFILDIPSLRHYIEHCHQVIFSLAKFRRSSTFCLRISDLLEVVSWAYEDEAESHSGKSEVPERVCQCPVILSYVVHLLYSEDVGSVVQTIRRML